MKKKTWLTVIIFAILLVLTACTNTPVTEQTPIETPTPAITQTPAVQEEPTSEIPTPAPSPKDNTIIYPDVYDPEMSASPGLPLRVMLHDLQSIQFTCDRGEFALLLDESEFSNRGQSITMQGDDIAYCTITNDMISENSIPVRYEGLVYWASITSDMMLDSSIKEATIQVEAKSSDGATYNQTLLVQAKEGLFYMTDITHQ